jgi:hypothetical protein
MRIKPIVLALALAFTSVATAQLMNLSPYSRFGLGDIYNSGNTGSLALGGVKTTFNDAAMINAENPATLGYVFNTTLQTGLRFNTLRLSQNGSEATLNNGFLEQFQMLFKRPGAKTGVLMGLSPFTTTGYAITTTDPNTPVGPVVYNYEGKGGITRAYAAVGRKFPIKQYYRFLDKDGAATDSLRVIRHTVSGGLTGNYLFGAVNQTRLVEIQNTTFLGTRATDRLTVSDFTLDLGVHYEWLARIKFGKDNKIVERTALQFAAIYSPERRVGGTLEAYSESVIFQGGRAFAIDTTFAVNGESTSILPQRLRSGVALHHYSRKGRHIMVALDYEARNWSRFQTITESDIVNPGLVSSQEVSFGVQYMPKPIEESGNFLERGQYRAGLRNTQTYLSVQGEQIVDRAVTVGLSWPMISSRSGSKFHLGMEFGQRGEDNGQLLREDYTNLYVGFSLAPFVKNAWFVTRKYD